MKQALRITTGILVFSTALPAVAALPPQHQRAREIAAIASDNAVHEALMNAPIVSITYRGVDRYDVKSANCLANVTIFDQPTEESRRPGWAGPRPFGVRVDKARCRR